MSAISHRLEDLLKLSSSDTDQASVFLGRLVHDNTQMFAEIETLKTQLLRRKEAQDQLKEQLRDVQTEVDVIYEVSLPSLILKGIADGCKGIQHRAGWDVQ